MATSRSPISEILMFFGDWGMVGGIGRCETDCSEDAVVFDGFCGIGRVLNVFCTPQFLYRPATSS